MPEEVQANFGAGQYLTVGIQKVWKRRPAVTHKNMIVSYISNAHVSADRLRRILALRVDLEVSACTINARRISLEDVIKIAYSNDPDLVEAACVRLHQNMLSGVLCELADTGVDDRGCFYIMWPLSDGLAQGLELRNPPRTWLEIVKDGRDVACFASLSSRCLTYQGRDDVENVQIARQCGGAYRPCASSATLSVTPDSRLAKLAKAAVLSTLVDLKSDAAGYLPLATECKVFLADGRLHIRSSLEQISSVFLGTNVNCAQESQLAFYERNNFLHRIDRRTDRLRGRELHDMKQASQRTVSLCIMDRP